jgi:UDP-N-acetylmuramoyl-L-alanyl-D-glutamate--2,6-diaminopimelate ligase
VGCNVAKILKELINLLPGAAVRGNSGVLISDIAHDSRKVREGTLFVCLPGVKSDGHDFVQQARERGAVAVLVQKDVDAAGITVIKVADTRAAMQLIAPYFFDYPGKKMRMIGITGTNGKTTTTYLIRSILQKAGFKVGVIGTIQILIEDKVLPIKNTTPDVIDLQAALAEMAESGMDYVVMEVSSHALALGRVAGCEFDVGVFTNMTRDHLDFHGTFENYLAAKAKLFEMLGSRDAVKRGKTAVVNVDDPVAEAILHKADCRHFTYGIENPAQIRAERVEILPAGAEFAAVTPQGIIRLKLNITGNFNVYNTLAAVGAALAENVDCKFITAALQEFKSVPGRFELVSAGQPFSVIVDYAHTPDGLENILKTARQFAKRKIIVVFGCGGDRDRTKRPIMGKLAAAYADIVIATSDNPRTEDPEAILQEIEAGIQEGLKPEQTYKKITDRRQAIRTAVKLAGRDDIVVIAGKGHETYQILKDKTIHFDDREIAREAIRGR